MPKTKEKPRKPYPDFPLTAHRNGQWCKKIRGKIHYFGTDANQALAKYLEVRDDLQAGQQRRTTTGITLRDLVNRYLTVAAQRRDAGELSALSFRDYHWTGEQILDHFGKSVDPEQIRPTEFGNFRIKMAEKYAISRLNKTVTVCKMIFRWGYESELLEKMPRFGPDFKTSTKRKMRIDKAGKQKKMFSAADIKLLLNCPEPRMKAMILLGINGGLGNTDIGSLSVNHVDLANGWIDFPRPKTGINRRIPLWPETIKSLKEVIESRVEPENEEYQDRVFLTVRGREFVVVTKDGRRVDKITLRFRKLLKQNELYKKQFGYYVLRHTFQTIADEAGDHIATSAIMGYADNSTAGNYRKRISDDRLKKVVESVRDWLYSDDASSK